MAVVALIVITLLLLFLFWKGRTRKKVMVKKDKNLGEEEEEADDSDYSSYQVFQESTRLKEKITTKKHHRASGMSRAQRSSQKGQLQMRRCR